MTNNEKIESLVRKAIDNGYRPNMPRLVNKAELTPADLAEVLDFAILCTGDFLWGHRFARALFGESGYFLTGNTVIDEEQVAKHEAIPMYQRRLQLAVISKDPVAYMHKAVFGE